MVIYGIFAAIFFWLLILSWIVWRVRNHYFKLVSRTKKEKIDEILDTLLSQDTSLQADIAQIKKQLSQESERSKFYLQKIGLIRFNPFERMGGEQSFVIALLDREDNGITANFIYTRDGLRVYTKRVKAGKGEEYDLSEEEKKAIAKIK